MGELGIIVLNIVLTYVAGYIADKIDENN
jgi:hypothetical protein